MPKSAGRFGLGGQLRSSGLGLRVLCFAVAGGGLVAGAGAQEVYDPLAPRGVLRIAFSTDYSSAWKRYRPGPGGEPGANEPASLGDDFSGPAGSRLFPSLAGYEEAVARAAGGEHVLRLGTIAASAERNSVRMSFAADVGVLDWLSVGATVPFVRNETEFSMRLAPDSALANAGFGPAGGASAVAGFLSSLGGAVGEYEAFRASTCAADPQGPGCAEATMRLSDAEQLRDALADMYGAPVAPLADSPAGMAIDARLAALAQAFQAAGIRSLPTAAPLASSPLDLEGLQQLVTDPRLGIAATHPLAHWMSLWGMGDVEVRANARLWKTGDAGSALQAEAGAGLTVTLPTGAQDDPANFLDAGFGDGQTDIVFRGWTNARWGSRFGVWTDVRYGLQLAGTTERRVFDPYFLVPPAGVQRQVRWDPGDYQAVVVAPWFKLADDLAALAGYRYFRKGADSFSRADAGATGEEPTDPLDLSPLAWGSETTAGHLHVGGVYRRGRAPAGSPIWPTEVRATYRRVVSGTGIVPVTGTFEVRLRFQTALWGRAETRQR